MEFYLKTLVERNVNKYLCTLVPLLWLATFDLRLVVNEGHWSLLYTVVEEIWVDIYKFSQNT